MTENLLKIEAHFLICFAFYDFFFFVFVRAGPTILAKNRGSSSKIPASNNVAKKPITRLNALPKTSAKKPTDKIKKQPKIVYPKIFVVIDNSLHR